MRIVGFVVETLVTAASALAAATAATWLWNLVVHSAPHVDWPAAVRLALLLGIGLPVTRRVTQPRRRRSTTGC